VFTVEHLLYGCLSIKTTLYKPPGQPDPTRPDPTGFRSARQRHPSPVSDGHQVSNGWRIPGGLDGGPTWRPDGPSGRPV